MHCHTHHPFIQGEGEGHIALCGATQLKLDTLPLRLEGQEEALRLCPGITIHRVPQARLPAPTPLSSELKRKREAFEFLFKPLRNF